MAARGRLASRNAALPSREILVVEITLTSFALAAVLKPRQDVVEWGC